MIERTRECGCGCGIPLDGPAQRRFVDDAHRKRAARRRAAGNGQKADVSKVADMAPAGGPGRVRVGLEAWVARRAVVSDLPEVTVEAARVLADELDADPDASPLWGRYTALVEVLTAPQVQAQALHAEQRAIFEELATIRTAEKWRADQARRARVAGEDPSRWGLLVPIGCAQGAHAWHPDNPQTCTDCYGRREDDGSMAWPDWVSPWHWNEP